MAINSLFSMPSMPIGELLRLLCCCFFLKIKNEFPPTDPCFITIGLFYNNNNQVCWEEGEAMVLRSEQFES